MKSSSSLRSRLSAPERSGAQSASPPMENMVAVGRLTRPQGLKGRVRVQPETDDPAFFQPGMQLWTAAQGGRMERLEVEQAEIRRRLVVLKLKGIDTIDQAEMYRGQWLYVESEEMPELPEDVFYYHEVIGCKVLLPDQSVVGEVKEILPGPAGEILVVQQGESEVLVPAVKEYVKSIDLTNRVISVDLPEDLL